MKRKSGKRDHPLSCCIEGIFVAAKRGQSGLSLIVGVDKPSGMSSHDVVNRVRRIFGERRVGHTGTLDPLASGVLCVCVGPATRLDNYMVGHDKHYRVRIAFGVGTDTDDVDGEPVKFGSVPSGAFEEPFALETLARFVGPQKQLPPAYSAVKVGGVKACDAARKGRIIELMPRDIEVYSAKLAAIVPGDGDVPVFWDVDFHVSKGTYIRALARDIGVSIGCPAHVAALRRTSAGLLTLDDCVSLDVLERMGVDASLDPVKLLGFRFAFLDEAGARLVANGNQLPTSTVELCERRHASAASELCACTAGVRQSCSAPEDGERIAVIVDNKLAGIYAYEEQRQRYNACCIFQTGVRRGGDI